MNNKLYIVGAIVLAGLIIAGAIIYTQKPPSQVQPAAVNTFSQNETDQPKNTPENNTNPQNNDEHFLGNPDALITLIEYSDIECPYCRNFHKTMNRLMDDYGKNGQLKWVYRHFPLEMLHPTATREAEATECAAELGGNAKFWEYLGKLSSDSIPKENIDNELTNLAIEVGLNENQFGECLKSGKYQKKIQDQTQEAIQTGANGTPFSIIISPKGKTPVPGALPYEDMKQIIEKLL